MILQSKASLQIQKTPAEVFEGIVNPEHMTQYFISESTGRLDSGKDIVWKFPEFDERFSVTRIKLIPNEAVSFVWDPETVAEITLEEQPDHSTVVRAGEKGKEFSEYNLAWVLENTEGWANFLACLKAYLEYGVCLRKGAFEFLRKQ